MSYQDLGLGEIKDLSDAIQCRRDVEATEGMSG
jgi:hypothetical protein